MPTANEAVPADPSCFYVKDKHRCPSPLKNVKLLCIPFLLTTLYVENFLLYVVKSNYFVVHYLMLPQTLINSVYGFSTHSVISRTVAALGGGGVPALAVPGSAPDPALRFFSIPLPHSPTAGCWKVSFSFSPLAQTLIPRTSTSARDPPSPHFGASCYLPASHSFQTWLELGELGRGRVRAQVAPGQGPEAAPLPKHLGAVQPDCLGPRTP